MTENWFTGFVGIKLIPEQYSGIAFTGLWHDGIYSSSALQCGGLCINNSLPHWSWQRWCRLLPGSN